MPATKSSKHIEWCLKKAQKEVDECNRVGKKPKHRGLVRVEPSAKIAKQHIDKAIHDLNAVVSNKENGYYDWCINIGFYSLYHCFLAIAQKFGYESGNQTCTIALIEWLKEEGKIDIEQKYIDLLKYKGEEKNNEDNIIDMREEYTYSIKISVEEQKINELIENCKELIDITKNIVLN
ncbi:MAG: HEPN domain-containing protein [archaeon]